MERSEPETITQEIRPLLAHRQGRAVGGNWPAEPKLTRVAGERRLVDPEGLEPPAPWFEARCSIQLSYGSRRGAERSADLEIFRQSVEQDTRRLVAAGAEGEGRGAALSSGWRYS